MIRPEDFKKDRRFLEHFPGSLVTWSAESGGVTYVVVEHGFVKDVPVPSELGLYYRNACG